MRRATPLVAALIIANAVSAPAAAQTSEEDERSAASKIFLYGESPGTPSTAKLATTFTLYAISLAGLGTGAYLLASSSADSEQLQRAQDSGCFSAAQCNSQAERLSEIDLAKALSAGAFAVGTLGLLGGITTALTWDNQTVTVAAAPTGAWATIHF